MADNVRTAQYFKMFVPHKPGVGVQLLESLAKAKVNLLALLAFPRKRQAQVDCVPADPQKFKAAAKRAKWKIKGPKTCLLIEGQDRIGAFAPHVAKLAAAKINIHATAAVTGGEGRCGVILWVKQKDVKQAAKVLGAK